MNLINIIRVVQAVLLLGALLTGLSWVETPEDVQGTRELGREKVAVGAAAPALHPRGPWTENTTFTHRSPGIPLDVAPHVNVTARYTATGPGVEAGSSTWNATLRIVETGEGGRTWWTVEEHPTLGSSGDVAWVDLNLSRVMQRAHDLEATADVPGSIEVQLVFEHRGTPTVRGETRASSHEAAVTFVPTEDHVLVRPRDDSRDYAHAPPSDEGIDVVPLLLLGGAVMLEPAVHVVRRRLHPWEQVTGVHAVEVQDLDVPPQATHTSLDDLLGTAQETGTVVLVDQEANRALLSGDTPLWARLPEEERDGDA